MKQENTIFSLIILGDLCALSKFCLNILSVFPKYFTYSAILRKVCAGKWGLNAFHFVVSGLFGFSITEDSWHLIVDLHAIFCFGNHDHARILCGSQNSGGQCY